MGAANLHRALGNVLKITIPGLRNPEGLHLHFKEWQVLPDLTTNHYEVSPKLDRSTFPILPLE
jgi:hypothetical protein